MSQETRLPKVGEFVRGVGTLSEVVTIPPPPPPPPTIVYVFEQFTAQMRVLLHGEIIKCGSTYNDFYGKGKCREPAIKEAKKFAKKLSDNSEIDVVVVQISHKTNQTLDPLERENFYARAFPGFRHHDGKPYQPEDQEMVIWSSRDDTPKTNTGKGQQ